MRRAVLMDNTLVARLAEHRTLGGAPPEELAWLASHGQLRHVEPGERIARRAEILDTMVILLSGHITIQVDRGLGPRKVMEWGAGDVSGFLPYSRMGKPPGDSVVDEAGDFVLVHRDNFPEMIKACPTVTAKLVHLMLDRVRRFTSSDLQDEKMMALGRLTAGLAHELNNPASAAARSARLLINGLAELEDASRALGASQLSEDQLAVANQSLRACLSAIPSALTPIERADREEAIADWLEGHGADPAAGAALLDTAATIDNLNALASVIHGDSLNVTLRWMAAHCSTRGLATDVEKASSRIHDLVAAMKRFTYMDRTDAPSAVDLSVSLGDSVALLLHKARKKSAGIGVVIEPDLPRVRAIGGDLNQVWTNLIDNAIDAVPDSGQVTITAGRHLNFVIVRIVDNGSGIPPEAGERIFDPFYTTKPVGQGTGLGLDISRRLVRRNDGDMEYESRPGRTEFRVTLPIAVAEPGGRA
jgi:signal transduction histidine kinase